MFSPFLEQAQERPKAFAILAPTMCLPDTSKIFHHVSSDNQSACFVFSVLLSAESRKNLVKPARATLCRS